MSFIPTPNAVRVALQGKVNSNDQVITLWFLGVAPAGISDLTDLAGDLETWATSNFLTLLSNGYTLDNIYLAAQDSSTAPALVHTGALPAIGAVNSPVIEPQTAPVVKFRTAARGRSGRGRNYVPGCPLNALSSPGVVGTTFKNALLGAYADIPAAVSAHGYTHVVVQHMHDKAPLLVGVPRTVIDYEMVSDSVGTQRRRRIGIGS